MTKRWSPVLCDGILNTSVLSVVVPPHVHTPGAPLPHSPCKSCRLHLFLRFQRMPESTYCATTQRVGSSGLAHVPTAFLTLEFLFSLSVVSLKLRFGPVAPLNVMVGLNLFLLSLPLLGHSSPVSSFLIFSRRLRCTFSGLLPFNGGSTACGLQKLAHPLEVLASALQTQLLPITSTMA